MWRPCAWFRPLPAMRPRSLAFWCTTLLWLSAGLHGACSDECPDGEVLRYETPGCGNEAKPVCGSPVYDACLAPACSCKGETFDHCARPTEPFVAFGVCPKLDGGSQ